MQRFVGTAGADLALAALTFCQDVFLHLDCKGATAKMLLHFDASLAEIHSSSKGTAHV